MFGYRLQSGNARSSGQLASLSHYREKEQRKQNADAAAVDDEGFLLEFESLELRIHPPNVKVDNDSSPDHTVLIIDSANRPGTLVEVVQCLTELGLSVRHARIASDGCWFIDEFHVTETQGGRVLDTKKLDAIRQVLSPPEHTGEPPEAHTVFQIAGPETPGLLAEVTQLLSHNGLEIRTAAAWTYHGRAALVIGVTEQNAVVRNVVKLQRLQQLLIHLVETSGEKVAVAVEQVEGPVHHERRLHQLLLADEIQAWKQLSRLQRQHSLPFPGPIHTQPPGSGAAANGAGDTAADSDQAPHTPSTPQQQWQRQMLPPTWTIDPRGRPMHREDAASQLQPRPWLGTKPGDAAAGAQQQQQQAGGMQGLGLDSGPPSQQQQQQQDTDPFRDAATTGTSQPHSQQQEQQQQEQQVVAMLPPHSAAPELSAAAAATVASAAAAAAAAEQASVDKLIALLQPQPLAHMQSLPPGQAPPGDAAAAAPQQQQQQQQQKEGVEAAGTAGTAAADGAAQLQQQQLQQQHGPFAAGPALPRAVTAVPADMAHALLGAGAAGLPPRAPPSQAPPRTSPGIVLPAQLQLLANGDTAGAANGLAGGSSAAGPVAAGTGRSAASLSAPTSPCVGAKSSLVGAPPGAAAAGDGTALAAGGAVADAAGGAAGGPLGGGSSSSSSTMQPPWSPRQLASAAAVAGLLSPRGRPPPPDGGGPGSGATGSSGGVLAAGAGSNGLMGLHHHQQQQGLGKPLASSGGSGALAPLEAPEVQIQHSHLFNYWLVEIRCRDRNKLFFDTVCTLSDMRYDIFHAAIDSEPSGMATQLFYTRPRFGECVWDASKAAVLKAMLVSAVQRRFPPGLRVHVFSGSRVCLQDLVSSFKRHKLSITRCKVRAYDHGSHTFFLLNPDQSLPSRQYVAAACQAAGGELVEAPLDVANPCVASVLRSLDARGRFAFSFVNQRAHARAAAAAAAAQHQHRQAGGATYGGHHAHSHHFDAMLRVGGGGVGPSGGAAAGAPGGRGVMAPGGPMDGVGAGGAATARMMPGQGLEAGVRGAGVRKGGGMHAPHPASSASYNSSDQPSY